jgi:hypothetical protein
MAESDAERAAREERERAAALDAYEARYATVHAAAIAVLNIKVLVPLVLDRVADNYNRWHALFLTVLGKYALTDHVLFDVVNTDRPAWVQMNCIVLTWIYGTIHADLQQSTMNRKPNARGAWTYLENEFLGQHESHALLLSAEFRTAKQGSSSVTDYCRRLETMAATLGDYGDPIGDRTLVLTLLHGLNGKFRPMVSNLKMRQPFPTFEEARTLLLLEEIDIDDIAASEAAGASDPPAPSTSTALVAAPRPPTGRHGQDGQGGHAKDGSPARAATARAARPATATSEPTVAAAVADAISSTRSRNPRRSTTIRGQATFSSGRAHRTPLGRRSIPRRLPSPPSSSTCSSRTLLGLLLVSAMEDHHHHSSCSSSPGRQCRARLGIRPPLSATSTP